jgi:hypothetical protein
MNKIFLFRSVLATALFSICVFSAMAQNTGSTTQVSPSSTAPAKGIGPAPANTKQNHILNSALSAETRQTLQQAMNSVQTAK